jgi:hypothetical protein
MSPHARRPEFATMSKASSSPDAILVASYPRSGNTLMRTVLNHCFGLQSASIYPDDLGGNRPLERYVGHVTPGADGKAHFADDAVVLVKTHEIVHPADKRAAIYVVRDGRAACLSIWHYYGKATPLEQIVTGDVRMGTWSDHIQAWRPWERPNTLLVKYEDMIDNLPRVVEQLAAFLKCTPIADRIPPREEIADVDGRWVRSGRREDSFPPEHLELFRRFNGAMMQKLGYWPA